MDSLSIKRSRPRPEPSLAPLPIALLRLERRYWPFLLTFEEGLRELWASRALLVRIFDAGDGVERLSVERLTRPPTELSWRELQRVKHDVGRGDRAAVEIFPADGDVVDVANMRHLWVLPEGMLEGIGWKRPTRKEDR